ncbi:MAG: leishmanolysin-related zinc metalloendopeptidase [Acidimicrobiales bacterium]
MEHRTIRTRRAGVALTLAATALLATACPPPTGVDPGTTTTTTSTPDTTTTTTTTTTTSTTTTIDPNNAPVIASFSAIYPSGPTPHTTPFQWSISDPDGDPMTCQLDVDGDGTYDQTVAACTSDSLRAATLHTVGTANAVLRVSDATKSATATTAVRVDPASADALQIDVRYTGAFTPSQEAIIDLAVTRWEQIIVNGFPDTSTFGWTNSDCSNGPGYEGPVDDLLLDVNLVAVDGPGAELGAGAVCDYRFSGGEFRLPRFSALRLDSADIASLEANGQLYDVVLHEMAHALGFGDVFWQRPVASPRLIGRNTSDPQFVAPTARAEWQRLGGTGNVPAAPTIGNHWRESVFGAELMTPNYNAGVPNPLSRVTLAALRDVGYTIDLDQADTYSLP